MQILPLEASVFPSVTGVTLDTIVCNVQHWCSRSRHISTGSWDTGIEWGPFYAMLCCCHRIWEYPAGFGRGGWVAQVGNKVMNTNQGKSVSFVSAWWGATPQGPLSRAACSQRVNLTFARLQVTVSLPPSLFFITYTFNNNDCECQQLWWTLT